MTPRATQHAAEDGFTLIELLTVLAVIGILLTIAIPAYAGFDGEAKRRAAAADLRAAIPTVTLYAEKHGSFGGMTPEALATNDSGIQVDHVVVTGAADDTYCLDRTVDGETAKVVRGAVPVADGIVVEGAGLC